MNISDIMTRAVYTCRPTDTLDEVARTMWERDCGCVPVIDEEGRVRARRIDPAHALAQV